MDDTIIMDSVIQKYFAGETSEQEEKYLLAWLEDIFRMPVARPYSGDFSPNSSFSMKLMALPQITIIRFA